VFRQPASPTDKTAQRLIICTVSFASLLGALDMSIVNISLPAIIKDWNIPVGLGSLVIISYLLTLTCLILVMGKFADRWGFRKILLTGFFIFGAGSALCGIAPDIWFLIGSRVVQATGAAMISAVGPAIITRYLPPSVRGRSLGYLIAFSALGFALGPGLGGFISGYFHWRWIFYLNLPVVLGAILLGYMVIPEEGTPASRTRFDLAGSALFCTFVAGILAAFSLYQVPGTPDSVLILLFAAGALAGILFFARERKSNDPLIDTALIQNTYFNRGVASCFIVTSLFSGVTFLLPLYLTGSRHFDQFTAGMIMTIPALISMLAAPVSGSLADRYGSPVVSAAAIGMSAIGFVVFSTFNPSTAVLVIVAGMIITRVSTAAFFGPNGRLIMGHCPAGAVGDGSGVMMTVRHAGLVVGIALFQSIFAIRMYMEGIPRDGTPLVPRLTPALSVLGYQAVFLTAFCLCLVTIVIILFTREAPEPEPVPENVLPELTEVF